VIASVSRREGLAPALGLNMKGALNRTEKITLKKEAAAAGIRGCLLLPIAPANEVHKVNELFVSTAEGEDSLVTAGTLHPSSPGMVEELQWLANKGIRAIKLCSFSQGFSLEARDTRQLFEAIRGHNLAGKPRFFVVLDTFYKADIYFGAREEYVTTPERLDRLAAAFPEIDFVGAHMGGLSAPFHEIDQYVVPRTNLYLDTSNASQALSREEFLRLIHRHGPERILFGTDWPWFSHAEEIARIRAILQAAGLSAKEQSMVFSGNMAHLLELSL